MNQIASIIGVTGLLVASFSATAQSTKASAKNEAELVEFAETIVMVQLAQELSLVVRREREKCSMGCGESGAMELAIGTVGLARGPKGSRALIDLLGLSLDGAASSELNCQILLRGPELLPRLKRFSAKQAEAYCYERFEHAKRFELSDLTDVRKDQVCRTHAQFNDVKSELVEAIERKALCE
jgi:hypothetical protein